MSKRPQGGRPQSGKMLSPARQIELQQTLNRAIAAHQANQLSDAERGYRKVLKTVPNQPIALNLLGVISIAQGKNTRAVQLLQKAVSIKPDFADAHNHLGIAFRKLGRHEEAVASFKRAVKVAPNLTEAHNNLGNALKDLARFEEAAQAYKKAIVLNQESFEPRYNLGNALRELEQIEPAIQSYREALARNPNHVEAWFNLAALLERKHDLSAALDAVDEVLERAPKMTGAVILRAKILRRRGNLDQSGAILEALDDSELELDDQISAAFELGKIYDRLGLAEKAFAHFSRGNLVQKTGAPKKLLRDAAQFQTDIARSTGQLVPGVATSWNTEIGNSDNAPTFLIGFPRSGTTLLDQLLDAHTKVQVMEERPVVTNLAKELRHRGRTNLAEYAAMSGTEIGDMRTDYFEQVTHYLDMEPGLMLVDKMPLNIIHVPLLARVFPEAKYVFALRHPFDVVLSNFMQLFQLNGAMANFLELETAAATYCAVMEQWKKAGEILPIKVHTVRYEDLVENFEGEAHSLLEFLELDWEEAVLNPDQHARARKNINTPSYEQVAEPVHQRAKYRWRHYLQQLQPVIEQLTPWVNEFGYSVDSSEPAGE